MRKLHELYVHAVFRQIVVVRKIVNSVRVIDAVPVEPVCFRLGGLETLGSHLHAKRPPAFPLVTAVGREGRDTVFSGTGLGQAASEVSDQHIFGGGGARLQLT